MQCVRIHTTRQDLTRRRNHVVIRTRQTGNGVKQNHDVLLVLHQTLRALNYHFGNLHVTRRWLIKRRRNDFTANGALHFGHFFRTLVNEQHNQMHIRMIRSNGGCDLLHQHRLTGLRRRHDQRTLTLTLRRHQIENTAGDIFRRTITAFQVELRAWEKRR